MISHPGAVWHPLFFDNLGNYVRHARYEVILTGSAVVRETENPSGVPVLVRVDLAMITSIHCSDWVESSIRDLARVLD